MTVTTIAPRQQEPPALIALLTRQHDLYLQLKRLSDDQMGHIAEGRTDALLGVLSQRQAVIESLGRVSADLTPFRQDWEQHTGRLPDGDRRRARELIAEVDAMLADILRQDEKARASLQEAQRKVGEELQQTAHAGGALNAYKVAARPAPRFADQQG